MHHTKRPNKFDFSLHTWMQGGIQVRIRKMSVDPPLIFFCLKKTHNEKKFALPLLSPLPYCFSLEKKNTERRDIHAAHFAPPSSYPLQWGGSRPIKIS